MIIMKFSAITVTVVALAAQLTITFGHSLNCEDEVAACLEIVIPDSDRCDGTTVTYCLQPRETPLDGQPCFQTVPLAPGTTIGALDETDYYSHINAYVSGLDVDLRTDSLPAAVCTGTDTVLEIGEGEKCEYEAVDGNYGCSALDDFDEFEGDSFVENKGLACTHSKEGMCVTVPLTIDPDTGMGTHTEIIFAIKDQHRCNTPGGGWTCTAEPTDDNVFNVCSCSSSKSACMWEGITSCSAVPASCGDGVKQPWEECDGGPGGSLGCSTTCERVHYCGDRNTDDGEECDAGPAGSPTCTTACKVVLGPASLAPHGGGVQGDPHFKTWVGKRFDFHGECDLILFQSSMFKSGLGVDLHIRTQLRRDMSYITSAALRIGTDVLEVASKGVYYLNGVEGSEMPNTISGFPISHTQPNENRHIFDVDLGENEHINIKTFKDFVSVMVDGALREDFEDSAGLMGAFDRGRMLARDGNTVLDDPNAFGQEWQVLHTEPKLFQTVRLPQHPRVCTMPAPKQISQRRLSESTAEELAAEKACAHWGEGKDDCVFDVLTTGDLEIATAGSY